MPARIWEVMFRVRAYESSDSFWNEAAEGKQSAFEVACVLDSLVRHTSGRIRLESVKLIDDGKYEN